MFGHFWFDDYIKAGHPTTSKDLLELLSQHDSVRVRRRVADNEITPANILERLGNDADPEVRLAVATNIGTPIDIVFALALDEDPTVRYGLAEDANAPVGVLRRLAKDDNPYVSTRAKRTLAGLNELEKLAYKDNVVAFPSLDFQCLAT